MVPWSADRLAADVERLGTRGLPYDDLHRELSARIRRTIPTDAFCWHGLDPDTRLLTTANPVELLEHGFLDAETEGQAGGSVIASEYLRPDVNTFASLAGRRTPSAILSETTRGRPQRSARYNDFLAVVGTPYEMRTAMVTRGRAWGCVVMHRTEASGDFLPEEARVMARLSRLIAEALRSSVRFDAGRRSADERAPGLLVLSPSDDVELMTPATPALIEPLLGQGGVTRTVPVPVVAMAAETRSAGRTGRSPAPLHVPTAAGWLTLHGSLPDGPGSGRVAVVVQPARREDTAPRLLEVLGLTAREREIALLVASGLDTAAIAERLVISPWTVQDHLKAIFDKTGARSRRQLRSTIFFQENLPGIMAQAPLDQRGHLAGVREPGTPPPRSG